MAEQELDVRTYTQGIRKKMVENMMPEGAVPNDTDSQRVILTTLNDMDKNDIGYKRLKQDEKRVNNDSVVADLVATILKDPNARLGIGPIVGVNSIVDSTPTTLVEGVEIVDGELDIGTHDLTYNSIGKSST